jgi:hypothetical protein
VRRRMERKEGELLTLLPIYPAHYLSQSSHVHYTKTKETVFLETYEKLTKILKHYSLETMKLI